MPDSPATLVLMDAPLVASAQDAGAALPSVGKVVVWGVGHVALFDLGCPLPLAERLTHCLFWSRLCTCTGKVKSKDGASSSSGGGEASSGAIDDILNSILPPREFASDGITFIQYVSKDPPSRSSVHTLQVRRERLACCCAVCVWGRCVGVKMCM